MFFCFAVLFAAGRTSYIQFRACNAVCDMLQEALDPDDMVDFSDVADGLHRTTSSMSNASEFKQHGKSHI